MLDEKASTEFLRKGLQELDRAVPKEILERAVRGRLDGIPAPIRQRPMVDAPTRPGP